MPRKKKGVIEQALDGVEKAIKKQAKRTARKATKRAGRAVRKSARSALDAARVKPRTMLSDMHRSGWTPIQIQARTGMSPRVQRDILAGRSSGARWLDHLRQARRSARSGPPSTITPVPAALGSGGGTVRRVKGGTSITVTRDTDRDWLAAQLKAARGTVTVRFSNKAGRPRTRTTAPKPKSAEDGLAKRILDTGQGETTWNKGSGIPPATRGRKKVMSDADAWKNAMAGSRKKQVTPYQKVRDLLKANNGDLNAALAQAGVSRKTWDSWTRKDPKKRTTPGKAAQKRIDAALNTPKLRGGAIPKRRMNRLKRNGMKVSMHGNIMANCDPKYARIRSAAVMLPGDATERVMDAYVEGGPDLAKEVLMEEMENYYTDNGVRFDFGELDEFRFEDMSEQDRLDAWWNDRDD